MRPKIYTLVSMNIGPVTDHWITRWYQRGGNWRGAGDFSLQGKLLRCSW